MNARTWFYSRSFHSHDFPEAQPASKPDRSTASGADQELQTFLESEYHRITYLALARDQQFVVRETSPEVLDERVDDLRKGGLL